MAQTPWSGLLTGSSTPFLASGDIVAFVDLSDTTQSPQGSLVKGTLTEFFAQVPVPVTIASASATAFAVGRLGGTTPAFTVDASTASQVAGLKVTGAVTGGTVAVVVTDSGANANLNIDAKGSGTITIAGTSTGVVGVNRLFAPRAGVEGSGNITMTQTAATAYLSLVSSGGSGRDWRLQSDTTGAMFLTDSTAGTTPLTIAGSTGRLTMIHSLRSVTALATPSAYAATELGVFASTVSGATLMGFGTTGDVTLKNRAGTDVVVVVANSTNITVAGTINSQTISATASFTGTVAVATSLAIGTTPAATGVIRLENNQSIRARNAGNTSNVTIAFVNTSDQVSIGNGDILVTPGTGVTIANGIGFYGTSPMTQQTVTGSRGGNVALASLLTKLATLGLIVDSTS